MESDEAGNSSSSDALISSTPRLVGVIDASLELNSTRHHRRPQRQTPLRHSPNQPLFGEGGNPIIHTPAGFLMSLGDAPDFTLEMSGRSEPSLPSNFAALSSNSSIHISLVSGPLATAKSFQFGVGSDMPAKHNVRATSVANIGTGKGTLAFPSSKANEKLRSFSRTSDVLEPPSQSRNRLSTSSRRSTQRHKSSIHPADSDYYADYEATSDDNKLVGPFGDLPGVSAAVSTGWQDENGNGLEISSRVRRSPKALVAEHPDSSTLKGRRLGLHRRAASEDKAASEYTLLPTDLESVREAFRTFRTHGRSNARSQHLPSPSIPLLGSDRRLSSARLSHPLLHEVASKTTSHRHLSLPSHQVAATLYSADHSSTVQKVVGVAEAFPGVERSRSIPKNFVPRSILKSHMSPSCISSNPSQPTESKLLEPSINFGYPHMSTSETYGTYSHLLSQIDATPADLNTVTKTEGVLAFRTEASPRARSNSLNPSVKPSEPPTRRPSNRRTSIISRRISGDVGIPVNALISPRPSSVQDASPRYHLREPTVKSYWRWSRWDKAPVTEFNLQWYQRLPVHGWCFLIGFILPPFWWWGCFLQPGHVVISRSRESSLIEEWNELDPDALLWRFRCRLVTSLTTVVYVPLIILAIVYG